MSELACLDGAIAPAEETLVPVTDPGLLRGDGAFEVVRVYDGTPLLLGEHLDRMERSAASLRLEGPFHRERYLAEAAELLEAPTSSFFWVDGDGTLCTPPLDDHVLASITRARAG